MAQGLVQRYKLPGNYVEKYGLELSKTETGLFNNFQLDPSRTCVYWSDRIDLPSDSILEYGKKLNNQ